MLSLLHFEFNVTLSLKDTVCLFCARPNFCAAIKTKNALNALRKCLLRRLQWALYSCVKWFSAFNQLQCWVASVCSVRDSVTRWSPWKPLEFNFRFQGCLKSPWKEEFLLKVLENSLNVCSDGKKYWIISKQFKDKLKHWAQILKSGTEFSKICV